MKEQILCTILMVGIISTTVSAHADDILGKWRLIYTSGQIKEAYIELGASPDFDATSWKQDTYVLHLIKLAKDWCMIHGVSDNPKVDYAPIGPFKFGQEIEYSHFGNKEHWTVKETSTGWQAHVRSDSADYTYDFFIDERNYLNKKLTTKGGKVFTMMHYNVDDPTSTKP